MWDLIVYIASWVLIIGGAGFTLIGTFGLLRLSDFWSRMHAVSVSESGGAFLLLAGMALQAGFVLVTLKLVVIGVFLFITGPSATHAIANAALVRGSPDLKNAADKKIVNKKTANKKSHKKDTSA